MKLHFGSTAEKEGMLIDFEEMKKEYQRYENWHPLTRMYKEKAQSQMQSVTSSLIEKTKKEARGKFDFNWSQHNARSLLAI